MAAVVGLLIVLEAAASLLLAAAFGLDLPAVAHFGSLAARGPDATELLRWGAALDVGGYLAFGLVVLFVRQHMLPRGGLVVDALTASGLGAVVVGATGAAVLATVGPALLADGAGALQLGAEASAAALELLGRVVMAGLWGTMVLGLLGAWLAGVGWLTRRDGLSALAALVSGGGMLAASLRTAATGRILPDIGSPLDALVVVAIFACVSLLFVWLLWLAIQLWRGPRGTRRTA